MDENEEYFQRQASHRQSRRRFRKINQKGERQTIIDTVDPYPAGKPPIARGYHTVSGSVHYSVAFIVAAVGRYPGSVLCSVSCFLCNLLCVLVENVLPFSDLWIYWPHWGFLGRLTFICRVFKLAFLIFALSYSLWCLCLSCDVSG